MHIIDYKFIHTLRVRWKECDVQGVAYYGSYLDFIDVAEAEYFRNLGIFIHDEVYRQDLDLAVVKVNIEYKSPAKLDDLIDIKVKVSNIGTSSLTKNTVIYRHGTNDLLATGETISVNFDSTSNTSRALPENVKKTIEHFEKES